MFEILKNNNNIICMKVSIPIVVYDGNGFSYINESKRIKERKYYLNTLYSNWELSSLEQHARLRTKPYFKRLLYSLDSPKRTLILDYVLKLLYFFTR